MTGAGNGDSWFQLREGTCSRVGTGLELLFTVPGGNDGGPIRLAQSIGLTFSTFSSGWVAEITYSYLPAPICMKL